MDEYAQDLRIRELDKRRCRRVFISHDLMFEIITGKSVVKAPGRAWIEQVHYSYDRLGFELLLRCPDFKQVPEGEVVPHYHFNIVSKA
jgi:hypothetical protein